MSTLLNLILLVLLGGIAAMLWAIAYWVWKEATRK